MIDKIDHRLKEWISSVIDSSYQVSFEHPGEIHSQPTVSVYLYHLDNSMPTSMASDIPFQVTLSYLITVQSDNQLLCHHTLGNLLFAASERTDFEVEFPVLPSAYWQSFGIAPLPYFILCLPLIKSRQVEQPPLIKQPPHIDMNSISQIEGIVLGPGDHPIPAAKITSEYTKIVAYSDKKGYFSMATDSKNQQHFKCIIDVKGKQYSLSVPMQKTQNAPITIHLDTIEV